MRYLFLTLFYLLLSFTNLLAASQDKSKHLYEAYGKNYQPEIKKEKSLEPHQEIMIKLGKKLFFDRRFSSNKKMACGTCHIPEKAFSDLHPKAIGNDGNPLKRRTMTLYHIGDDQIFFWDGRANSLKDQMREAIENPKEMDFSFLKALRITQQDPDYVTYFKHLKQPITEDTLLSALEVYIKNIQPPKTRFDEWIAGDMTAMTAQELNGFELFNRKAMCAACHFGYQFKDGILNDIGLADDDLGHGALENNPEMYHFFKTPSLRGVAHRAPYMHDGSLKTLEAVIDHYNAPEFKRGTTDIPPENEQDGIIAFHNFTQPLNLTDAEKKALIAFLKIL